MKRFVRKIILSTAAFSFVTLGSLPALATEVNPSSETEYIEIKPNWFLGNVGWTNPNANTQVWSQAGAGSLVGSLGPRTPIEFLEQSGAWVRIRTTNTTGPRITGWISIGNANFPTH